MALKRTKRDPAEPPRFYVYISDAKVDMLLGQIPAGLLERLAAEVTVDLKILSVKGGDPRRPRNTLQPGRARDPLPSGPEPGRSGQ